MLLSNLLGLYKSLSISSARKTVTEGELYWRSVRFSMGLHFEDSAAQVFVACFQIIQYKAYNLTGKSKWRFNYSGILHLLNVRPPPRHQLRFNVFSNKYLN